MFVERSGALWSVLECFRNVLERFSAVWSVLDTLLMKSNAKSMKINAKQKQMEVLEAVIGGVAYSGPPCWRYRRACIRYRHPRSRACPGTQLRGPLGTNKYQRRRNSTAGKLQTSTDHLPTHADTQLGAFGPGADPTRSRAAYPPPRQERM